MHNYTYDAEGNITQVDGGATARYYYDAGNRRIRADAGGTYSEFVFDLENHIAAVWNGANGATLLEQNLYWGPNAIAFTDTGSVQNVHQDWLGTERMVRSYTGALESSFSSLPYGDSVQVGSPTEPFHFAGLDRDGESGLDHAQYRSYSVAQGRWLSPDPYDGSYSGGDPQSLSRYAYVSNSPLSIIDPAGLDGEQNGPGRINVGGCIGAIASGGENVYADAFCVAQLLDDLLGFLHRPKFRGSLHPRPSSSPWDEYHIHYGPNIAGALGLPDQTCDFGACGGSIGDSFQQGAATAPLSWCVEYPTICKKGADALAFARAIPAVTASVLLLNMEGDNKKPDPARAACYTRYFAEQDRCSAKYGSGGRFDSNRAKGACL